MVKTVMIPFYECELCKSRYNKKEWAEECEKLGMPNQKFRIGERVKFTSYYDGKQDRRPIRWMDNVDKGTVIETHLLDYNMFHQHIRMYKVKFDNDKEEFRVLNEFYLEKL